MDLLRQDLTSVSYKSLYVKVDQDVKSPSAVPQDPGQTPSEDEEYQTFPVC